MASRGWTSNTPISVPLRVANPQITADFNGLKWSDQWGFLYDPETPLYPWQNPPPTTMRQS